jgi:hypothetical protein
MKVKKINDENFEELQHVIDSMEIGEVMEIDAEQLDGKEMNKVREFISSGVITPVGEGLKLVKPELLYMYFTGDCIYKGKEQYKKLREWRYRMVENN